MGIRSPYVGIKKQTAKKNTTAPSNRRREKETEIFTCEAAGMTL